MDRKVLRRRVRALSLGATALAGGCLVSTATWAQGQGPAAQRAREAAAPSEQSGAAGPASRQTQVEEVVVTAEKRAEGLQNVSNAITAVSGATLERASVREVG